MLIKATPELAALPFFQGMCANAHNAWSGTAVGAILPRFQEEIDTAFGPRQSTGATG